MRPLGNTGMTVSALGLGGVCWNLLEEDADAVRVVHRAIDSGITYLDTASGYNLQIEVANFRFSPERTGQEADGVEVTVVEYLKNPPTREKLAQLYSDIGITPSEGLRIRGTDAWKQKQRRRDEHNTRKPSAVEVPRRRFRRDPGRDSWCCHKQNQSDRRDPANK